MEAQKTNIPVFILILVISLTPVNAVLYAPALPKLAILLNVSKTDIQNTIALFLAGYAVSQLIFGILANHLGRKKTLFSGILLGTIGSLLCIVSYVIKNYHLLLYSRFFVGVGLASGLIVTYAMINDVYTGAKAKKITSYIVASFAVAPGLANLAGGFLATISPLACFNFLFIYNLFVLTLISKLPETATTLNNNFNFFKVIKDYKMASLNPNVFLYGIIYGIFAAILYSIISVIPFVAINKLYMSPAFFGFVFCISYIGYFSGSLLTSWLAEKINTNYSILIGIILAGIGNFGLIYPSAIQEVSIFSVFSSIFIIFTGMPLIFVNASVKGVSSHSDKATASSVLNFINVSLACIGSFLAGTIKTEYISKLSYIIYTCLSIAVIILVFSMIRKRLPVSTLLERKCE